MPVPRPGAQPLDYQHPKRTSSVPSLACAFVACAVGLTGNVLGMLAASSLRHVPPGTFIRPMGLAALLFFIALGTAGVGLPLAILALVSGRRRMLIWLVAVVGIALSLMPLFTSRMVWDWIVARRGLIEEP